MPGLVHDLGGRVELGVHVGHRTDDPGGADHGALRAAWDAIFRAYFGEARRIFDVDVLLDLADDLGLDRETTRQVLADGRFRQRVREEAQEGRRLGATGAPFIVFDRRYAVPGAQDSDTLLDVLRKVWDETRPSVTTLDADGASCGPDGCATPRRPCGRVRRLNRVFDHWSPMGLRPWAAARRQRISSFSSSVTGSVRR
ncbi:DsbA family protein [Streptomyces sp. NPDC001902]